MSTREEVIEYLNAITADNGETPDCFWDMEEGQLIDSNNIEDWLERHPQGK